MVNVDVLQGKWAQLRGKVKQRWAALSDNDIERIQGSFDVLAGLIQEKYGYTKERAEREVNSFIREMSQIPQTGQPQKPSHN